MVMDDSKGARQSSMVLRGGDQLKTAFEESSNGICRRSDADYNMVVEIYSRQSSTCIALVVTEAYD